MEMRFKVDVITEHGYPHYSILDSKTGQTVHCDLNELNETLYEMMEEK